MKSFKEMVGANADSVRETRVNNFVNMLQTESALRITTGENSIQSYRALQCKLEGLLDIAPETTVDLSAKLATIDCKQLMKEVNDIVYSMVQCARAIKRRCKVHNTLFPDNPVTGLSDAELDFIKDIL